MNRVSDAESRTGLGAPAQSNPQIIMLPPPPPGRVVSGAPTAAATAASTRAVPSRTSGTTSSSHARAQAPSALASPRLTLLTLRAAEAA